MTFLSKSALCAVQSWNVNLEEFHAAGHVILLAVLQPLLIDSSNCISKFGTLATQDTLLCSPLSFDDLLMSHCYYDAVHLYWLNQPQVDLAPNHHCKCQSYLPNLELVLSLLHILVCCTGSGFPRDLSRGCSATLQQDDGPGPGEGPGLQLLAQQECGGQAGW